MKGVTGETQLAKKVSEDRKSKEAIVEVGGWGGPRRRRIK